ncbi:MAG: flavin-containing monooxygenase [Actinomycetales bacterium]
MTTTAIPRQTDLNDQSIATPVTDTATPASTEDAQGGPLHVDVLIVGAGLSGIGTAHHITQAFPERSIALIERRERVGGTWDLFRYPGIRSDSDMFSFGYNFRPWDDLKTLADGDSIRQYIEDTAREDGVLDKIHHGLRTISADWSSSQGRWTVTAVHEATGQVRTFTCTFFISCTGYYNHDEGYLPQFPGIEEFGGQVVHPQHWPEDLDYAGKKVVVIGSGATAVTLIPAMADSTEHITMLQRSPSYVFSLPSFDKISQTLRRVLPKDTVYQLGRRRNIAIQRALYLACRRWPKAMRRYLLSQVQRQVGPNVDMAHFTPNYMPWDERLCAVPDGDLFRVLREGKASVVTDRIDTFTENGIRLESGQELEADIVITATGLNLQMLGGMTLSVDGQAREFADQLTYKATLIESVPNMAWMFGYTNAPWTLKSDLAGEYLCRLFQHMDENGYDVVEPRDTQGMALDSGMLDSLASGYVQRGKGTMPRQGTSGPWQVRMHLGQDSKMLLSDRVDDGHLVFSRTADSVESGESSGTTGSRGSQASAMARPGTRVAA